ncbi:baseplate J/gp47 family protein [Acetobacter senegalensis]|uniref:baseplate J/gp47 family protein n=1 Tax=Acetobacter senegalensis TaxID=446692 RepID=UPI001EDA9DD0|nr:baseplate J/gp47 family protein [Acetobacter senegalensis]
MSASETAQTARTGQATSGGTTSVPAPVLDATGFIMPEEPDMLAGVLADLNAAFGNTLNTDLSTPQGQLAMSLTAILGDAYDQFLALANGVDPARASGRMQDAIGRLYFMSRLPATATVVTCLCTGVAGTVIPQGALVQDASGNSYAADTAITLDATGTGSGTFSCTQAGEVVCPAQSVGISQSLAGWATVTNPVAGVTGSAVESRTAFEERRRVSVAANAIGPLDAISAAVQAVPGVTDAFVTDNSTASATTMGGVTLAPYSLYVCANGGADQAIAQAILRKKPPGCAYTGSTTVTVTDPNSAYNTAPSYTVSFQRATPTPLFVKVTMVASSTVPSTATTAVQAAIQAAFSGDDGGSRARIGATLYASRFYAGIAALGTWAQIADITLGMTAAPTGFSATFGISQVPTLDPANISVVFA